MRTVVAPRERSARAPLWSGFGHGGLGWTAELVARAVWGPGGGARHGPLLFREGLIFSVGLTLFPLAYEPRRCGFRGRPLFPPAAAAATAIALSIQASSSSRSSRTSPGTS